MMNLVNLSVGRLVPIVAGVDVITNVKNSVMEIIVAICGIIIAGHLLKNLGGGKKIALLGGLVIGIFVLAALGSLDTFTEWIKDGFSAMTGLQWK